MISGFSIFTLVLLLLVVLTLFAGVKTVTQGYNWTIERFGKYTRTLAPGLNIIVPYFDRVGRKVNMMEQVIDVPQQEVITKDNATITVDGVAFYQVFDAMKASYEVSSLNQAILTLTMTNIRSVMGAMDLDQALSHRDEINERLLRVVDAAVSPWGVKVNRIEIKDIVPPSDLVEAMGRQMKAERVKRADILQAEGQRQSEILRAEGEKQAQILQAEGRREAAFRDAEARERAAEAEAKATQMVSESIAKGDVAALNYFIADRYIKAFGEIARSPNQKIIMLPIEADQRARLARRHRRDRQGDVRHRWCRSGQRGGATLGAELGRHAEQLARNAMWDMLVKLGPWNWLIVGLVLMALELVAPGVFLLWLGLAALLVGIISLFTDWIWQVQVIAFAAFSLAAVPLWRRLATQSSTNAQSMFLNRRSDALVGRVFTLDKPIMDGSGTVRVDDTIWRVSGPDCPAGSKVKVVRADGASLTVEAA